MDRDGNNPGGMKDGGSVPDGRPEDGTAPSGAPEGGDTPSGAPEGGDANGNGAPGGQEMPQGQPDDGAAPAGDEVTITITSDTKISMDENGTETEASADDIAVGCMIGITYGEDGETVTEITIYQAASQAPAQDGAK